MVPEEKRLLEQILLCALFLHFPFLTTGGGGECPIRCCLLWSVSVARAKMWFVPSFMRVTWCLCRMRACWGVCACVERVVAFHDVS